MKNIMKKDTIFRSATTLLLTLFLYSGSLVQVVFADNPRVLRENNEAPAEDGNFARQQKHHVATRNSLKRFSGTNKEAAKIIVDLVNRTAESERSIPGLIQNEIEILNIGNLSVPGNRPTSPTTFSIRGSYRITFIQNYHWNDGSGTSRPGTIGLRHSSGQMYGSWQAASGGADQLKTLNVLWQVRPNVTIPPGTYTVIDSEPSTWSQNQVSGGKGFTIVRGYADTSTAPDQTETRPTPTITNGKFPVGNTGIITDSKAFSTFIDPYLNKNYPGWKLLSKVDELCSPEFQKSFNQGDFNGDGKQDFVLKFVTRSKGYIIAFLQTERSFKPFVMVDIDAVDMEYAGFSIEKKGKDGRRNDAISVGECASESVIFAFRNGKFVMEESPEL